MTEIGQKWKPLQSISPNVIYSFRGTRRTAPADLDPEDDNPVPSSCANDFHLSFLFYASAAATSYKRRCQKEIVYFHQLISLPKSSHSRVTVLHEVVDKLLANHDYRQLNAKLAEAAGGITNVAFQLEKLVFSRAVIARVAVEPPLEKRNVDQRWVVIHEFKNENLERVRVLVFGLSSRVLHGRQINGESVVNLENVKVMGITTFAESAVSPKETHFCEEHDDYQVYNGGGHRREEFCMPTDEPPKSTINHRNQRDSVNNRTEDGTWNTQ
jgi:hypothetical protein